MLCRGVRAREIESTECMTCILLLVADHCIMKKISPYCCMKAGSIKILTKAAFNKGMNTSVFVFYRHAVGTFILAPTAFVLERRRAPPLSYKILFKLFIHAFFGIAVPINIYNIGLDYTSPTAASAIWNIFPVVSFFLAVVFGMEFINVKRLHGIAKASGIVLCTAGVVVLALYKGPELESFNHHHLLHLSSCPHGASRHTKKRWILGTFLVAVSTASWSLWTVLQGPLLKEFPSKLVSTTLQCMFAAIQSFFIALVLEKDFSRWKLGLDVTLISVIYTGIFISGASYYLQAWTVEKKGPVFLAMSMPLTLILTIILSSLILGEAINLGSVLGGMIMVGGLYSVLWGQRKEEKAGNNQTFSDNKTSLEKEMALPVHGTPSSK